ncbi:hypothetical protein D3C71_423080 [compost metagenome]
MPSRGRIPEIFSTITMTNLSLYASCSSKIIIKNICMQRHQEKEKMLLILYLFRGIIFVLRALLWHGMRLFVDFLDLHDFVNSRCN